MRQTAYGIGLYLFLMLPSITEWMESVMIVHMLVQFPLLIIAGYLMGKEIIISSNRFFQRWNGNGIPGIFIVLFITTYWMFPRTMDEALSHGYIEMFKFISLPVVGLCLADSWKKLRITGKSFLFLNYLPMFGLMAWLYIDSPIQICNNYLETEQKMLGFGFAIITVCMVLYLLQAVFIDHSEEA